MQALSATFSAIALAAVIGCNRQKEQRPAEPLGEEMQN